MPARRIRVAPAAALAGDFDAIRREAHVEVGFPPNVEQEAERAAAALTVADRPRVELPFVTIDPPGSRDLDQALHIERRDDGHRVHYAIADVAAFVKPGGAIDREARARAVTVYAPDRKAPLHPPVISEGAGSLLPGEWRAAVLWTLDLDGRGELASVDVRRVAMRSVEQRTYADVPAELAPLLREVGERRLELERERGGIQLEVPEQEVVREDDAWTVHYRAPEPSEEHNAQVSLMTGMAAASLMLRAGVGVLRTQPQPEERALERLRRQALALRVDWPAATPYAEFIRSLDPTQPAHAALLHEATAVGRAATYTAFDGAPPPVASHFALAAPYAHATAPLRRLQDRFVSECCLAACAGVAPPGWVRSGLEALPEAMQAGSRRAGAVERAVVDLVEAVVLAGREGDEFDAVVIDEELVQLRSPAVRGRLEKGDARVGSEVRVRLERSDPAARSVIFSPAN
jgi:exoribonuclease R